MQDTRTRVERSQVAQLVMSSLQELLTTQDGDAPAAAAIGEDTRLVGREAVLDSMGLVNLIVDVEQRLEAECGLVVILADERAMSQQSSPFRSVQTLTDYICGLAQRQG